MEYTKKLEDRIMVWQTARDDMSYRADVLERCFADTLYWFDNFAFTFDPRREVSQLPFMPYEGKQRDYIKFLDSTLQNPEDIFIDKPRDVGATALTMNWILKHWLFDQFFNARIGSRKEDYVDSTGDPDTLFYKIDYTLKRLPRWMIPAGFDFGVNRTYMKLNRPDNSNSIIGESANPSFARGGRQTVVIFDELGFWTNAKSAWESAGDVTNMRVAMTTPPDSGRSSFAYKLISGQAGRIKKFEFSFSDIPSKNEEWLAEQSQRRSKEEFEREIMKSYAGTTEGKVYATEWRLHVAENDCDYNPLFPLFVAWDFGLDEVAMIWLQKNYKIRKVYVIDSYHNSDKPIDYYVPLITGEVVSSLYQYDEEAIEKIRRHKEWKKDITHYGDPDVQKRNLVDKKSAFDILREKNIYINSKPWAGRKHRDIRQKTLLLLRRLEVNTSRNEYFIECVLNAMYPKTLETSQSTTENDKPIHDWTSHFRSALEYFADNEPDFAKTNTIQNKKESVKLLKRPRGGYR